MYVHICMYVCMYECVCMCVCVYVCVCMYMCMCMYMYIHVQYVCQIITLIFSIDLTNDRPFRIIESERLSCGSCHSFWVSTNYYSGSQYFPL